ncbi:hypothetical protein LTR62_003819 [Meristemomyces frigidus]|uniref:Antitoxin n=1 Tax=Meristemomyces frigidus TaxID=1508187 RepID=A0AAN7YGE6_9PEZI|nr:hypothetical protein LTR62_003819 [Meristemomyces frigidus]
MSGLMDKAKEAMGGNKQGGASTGGQPSGTEKGADSALNKGIDQATDRAGMGDKYDAKIDKFADGQANKQIPGGQN